jgi:hypothetical protein
VSRVKVCPCVILQAPIGPQGNVEGLACPRIEDNAAQPMLELMQLVYQHWRSPATDGVIELGIADLLTDGCCR